MIGIVQAALAFGMLAATCMMAWIMWKQYRKARDDEWKQSIACAFLEAHAPTEGVAGPQAQEQFDIDAEMEGAQYAAAGVDGPCESVEFPDGSRLYCLDGSQCQWVRDIPMTVRLQHFLLGAQPPVPLGELALIAGGVVILVGLAAWGINEAVEGMFVDLEQRMREAAGLESPAERQP